MLEKYREYIFPNGMRLRIDFPKKIEKVRDGFVIWDGTRNWFVKDTFIAFYSESLTEEDE